ncbi:hypothetical protein, partial [Thauera butanivorans]|uniref:hypothetical protein n=1 Tax=Thauera butanivorans TaxID=86174 RepID=UPI0009FFF943
MQNVGMVSNVNVGLVHAENVGLLHSSIVAGQRIEMSGANKREQVGGSRNTEIGEDDTLKVSGECKIDAKRIELSGSEEIVLSCGSSTVRLTPQLIEILSSLVKINC